METNELFDSYQLVESYITKSKSIQKTVDDRLKLIFESMKIYDDLSIRNGVISKIGYEIDEILSKISELESNRKSIFNVTVD